VILKKSKNCLSGAPDIGVAKVRRKWGHAPRGAHQYAFYSRLKALIKVTLKDFKSLDLKDLKKFKRF